MGVFLCINGCAVPIHDAVSVAGPDNVGGIPTLEDEYVKINTTVMYGLQSEKYRAVPYSAIHSSHAGTARAAVLTAQLTPWGRHRQCPCKCGPYPYQTSWHVAQ